MVSMRLGIAIVLFMGLVSWGVPAPAQSENAVAVLGSGGVESVEVFDVADDPQRVIRLGSRRIVPEDVGPARVADFVILPDGGHLLADVDGRGAAVTTPSGESFRWVLDEQQRFTNVDSVAVGSYFAPGEPSQVLVGDSASSNITIRSTSRRSVSWFESVRLTISRGDVLQLIAMPDNRIAFAVHWPTIGVWGLEFRDVADIMDNGTSLLSASHAEAPDTATIVPELQGMVDVMGLPDGNLLVTTRFDLFVMTPQGEVVDSFSTGDFESVQGEFSSARWLETGLIAASTFQPGEWVRPHNNHRIHWLDPQNRTVVATSEALGRAPIRIDLLGGHGGTGTLGFDGGLDDIQQGDPTTVNLVRLDVSPPQVPIGEELTVQATLENQGEFPVGLSSVVVRGSVGDCQGELQRDFAFASAQSVALGAGASQTFIGETLIDSQIAMGPWCVFVEAQDQQGQWHRYGEPTAFEVVERDTESDSTIEVTPLPVDVVIDAGRDAGPDGGADAGTPGPPEKGCCATIASGERESAGHWWLALLAAFIAVRRLSATGRARR